MCVLVLILIWKWAVVINWMGSNGTLLRMVSRYWNLQAGCGDVLMVVVLRDKIYSLFMGVVVV